MTQTLGCDPKTARMLSPDQITAVLGQAVAQRASVRLLIPDPCRGVRAVTGVLLEHTPDGLVVGVDDSDDRLFEDVAASVRVALKVASSTYFFEATGVQGEGAGRVLLSAPVVMHTGERRRSTRMNLRRSTAVILSGGLSAGTWRAEAALLNVNDHGLACRLDAAEARRLRRSQSLRVAFSLCGERRGFDLPARVVNVIDGSGNGRIVVGVEFVFDDVPETERSRLRNLLRRSEDGNARTNRPVPQA